MPETFPLPATSFLGLRAFSLQDAASVSSRPQLVLEDVAIVTPSCRALALHQELACRSSPSPNFTVTPTELRVWSYTTQSVRASNVTLSCSGRALPFPCLAQVVNSARDLAAALPSVVLAPDHLIAALGSLPGAFSADIPIYAFLNRSLVLQGAWDSPLLPEGLSETLDYSSPGQLQLTLAYSNPLVIAGAPPSPPSMGRLATGAAGNNNTARAMLLPPTILDLGGIAGLLALPSNTRIELHNLTLVNLPLGRATTYPDGLLTLPLWSFTMPRLLVGDKSRHRLLGRGLAVELPPEELALWHYDLRGSVVPSELAGCLCAVANSLLQIEYGDVAEPMVLTPSPLPGGGLYVPVLQGRYSATLALEQLILVPRWPALKDALPSKQPEASGVQQQPGEQPPVGPLGQGRPPSPGPPPPAAVGLSSGTASLLYPGVSPPLASVSAAAPLCRLWPPWTARPPQLNLIVRVAGPDVKPYELTVSSFMVVGLNGVFIHLFEEDSVFRLAPLQGFMPTVPADDWFNMTQARIIIDTELWFGDPLAPRLLHLSHAASTVNIRSPNGTLTLRQLVLGGLPPAALHPSSLRVAAPPASSLSSTAAAAAAGASARVGGGGIVPAPPPLPSPTPAPPVADGGVYSAGNATPGGASALAPIGSLPPVSAISNAGASVGRRLLQRPPVASAPVVAADGSGPASFSSALAGSSGGRRLAQVGSVNGIPRLMGPPAGVDATGGLPAGLANFTSCLWALDFDRAPPPQPLQPPAGATSGGLLGRPRVFLDSAVLLVPALELAVMATAWAEYFSDSKAAAAMGGAVEAADTATAFRLQAADHGAGLTAVAADAVLAHLGASLNASQLVAGVTPASLQRLTSRLLAMHGGQDAAAPLGYGADGTGGSSSNGDGGGSGAGGCNCSDGGGSTSPAEPCWCWAALAFEAFSWCGLAGRNVTLAAELPASWGNVSGQPVWGRQLWRTDPLQLPLEVVARAPELPEQPAGGPASPPPDLGGLPPEPQAPADLSLAAWDVHKAGAESKAAVHAAVSGAACAVLIACVGLLLLWVRRRRRWWQTHAADGSSKLGVCDEGVAGRDGHQARLSGEGPVRGGTDELGGGTRISSVSITMSATNDSVSQGPSAGAAGGVAPYAGGSQPGTSPGMRPRRPTASFSSVLQPRARSSVAAGMAALLSRVDSMRFAVAANPSPSAVPAVGGKAGGGKEHQEPDLDGRGSELSPAPKVVDIRRGTTTGSYRSGSTTTGTMAGGTGSSASGRVGGKMHLASLLAPPPGGAGDDETGPAGAPPAASAAADDGDDGRGPEAAGCGGGLVLLCELGRGAQGVVFRGRWRGLDVAVKSATFQQGGPGGRDPRSGRRPIQEAAIAASLSHPNIVATYAHQLHRVVPLSAALCPETGGGLRGLGPVSEWETEELHSSPDDSGGGGGTFGGGGGEAAVWRLTLVQELCDAGSLRGCLDRGCLAGCRLASEPALHASSPAPGLHLRAPQLPSPPARRGPLWDALRLPCPPASPAGEDSPAAEVCATPERDGAMPPQGSPGAVLALSMGDGAGLDTSPVQLPPLPPLPPQVPAPTVGPNGALSSGDATQSAAVPNGSYPWSAHQAAGAASWAGTASHGPTAAAVVAQGLKPPEHTVQAAAATAAAAAGAAVMAPPSAVSLLLALQAARGLAYMHSLGVLHGDLSSANVLLKSANLTNQDRSPSEQQPQAASPTSLYPPPRQLHSPPQQQQQPQQQSALSSPRHPQQPAAASAAGGWVTVRGWRHSCGFVAKLCDFGLSGRLEGSESQLSGDARRSLLYSAPELVQYGAASRATDVYALAVLLYELCCGGSLPALLAEPAGRGAPLRRWLAEQEAPGAPPAALPPRLLTWPPCAPPGLIELAADCLAEDPADRPDAEGVCGRLEAELEVLLAVGRAAPAAGQLPW